MHNHYLRGALFENLIITEILKQGLNKGAHPDLYYWRDNTANEIDLVVPEGQEFVAMEIKSASRIAQDFFKNIGFFQKLTGIRREKCYLIYAGSESQERTQAQVRGWKSLPSLAW